MYFPKSQIKTNLYTKGNELYYSTDNREYVGFYFETSTGEYYTGKTPSDKPNTLLIKKQPQSNNNVPLDDSPSSIPQTKQTSLWSIEYLRLNPQAQTSPLPPTQFYPQPTPEDYSIGEFQRYFVKRTNEPKFIEINKTQYDKYLSKDPQVAYQLYIPFTIPWEISGDRNNVFNINKNTVERIEQRQQLWGLKSYFKDRYTQFYK